MNVRAGDERGNTQCSTETQRYDMKSRHVPVERAMVVNEQTKKQLRIYTRMRYTSMRYDMSVDELEGYACLFAMCTHGLACQKVPIFGFGRVLSDLIGTFEIEPNKVVDAVFVLELPSSLCAQEVKCVLSQSCFDYVQIAGFRLQRSLFIGETPKCNELMRSLVSECPPLPYAMYAHLYLNEGRVHANVQKTFCGEELSHESSRAIDVLGELLDEIQWDDGCFDLIRRLARMGLRLHDSASLRRAALKRLLKYMCNHAQLPPMNVVQAYFDMLGPSLACIPLLYLQVLPYLSCLLRQESERAGVLRIVASCILPGMSCMKPNPMISRQLWEVLCRLSFAERGRIYQSVLHLSNGWSDAMKTSERRAGVATYRILRRLSRENVKFLGRKLGKLVSCFPINTSIIILEHVEAYPNMIDPIVGSLKYSNSLALDVLLHQLLRRLSNGRDKLKTDGQHVATWFSALCSFTGILCKKYPRVELRAVVHYILGALKDGESVDLLILRELIESMAGIKVVQDMSEDKMLLGCAGPHLRMFRNSQAGPTLEHTKGAARLRVALSTADTCNTTARMLLLIARCRHDFIQTARSEQLKFISQWYDECHHVFLQYVSFLRMAYTAEECFRVLPTACSLTKDYGLEPSVVYHIFRPHFTCLQRATGCSSNSHDCEAVDVKAVLDDWENAIPCETLRFISSDMYTTFWRLNLDDVFIHDEGYSTAIIACEAKVKAFEHVLQRTKGENPEAIAGMSNFSAHIKNLASERAKKTAANQALVEALKQFSKSWITSEDRCGVVRCILEHMIFPRVKMSGLDAYYAARFISLLHELDTPLFNALLYQDRLIRDFNQLAHACSPRENSQLGMYMLCSLNQFLRWREKSIYALQCQPFNTFSIPSTRAWRQANWDDYSIISYNWQVRLTKAILTQLDKGGYMELRNILEILVRIIPKFPSIHSQGAHIRKRIMRLRKLDHRSDIQTIATRYLAMLDAGRNNWISDDDFRNA